MSSCYRPIRKGKILKQRYEILKPIGSGAFGDTYIAADRDFPGLPHRVVKHLCPSNTDPASLNKAKELFKQEAICLSKLGEYSQIPRLFAYFEENNEFYLVQELVEGHNLTQEFQPGKKWSESETVNFLTELLSILSIVHQNNTIHRDIKPANIMRRRDDGKLVLIDFGAVKEVMTVDRNGQTTIIVDSTCGIGTPVYMPREQEMGNPRKCSDIYAVGILGIQAVTGWTTKDFFLHPEPSHHILQDSNIEVSSKLKSILVQMTSLDYTERYPNAESALEAFALLKSKSQIVKPQYKNKILLFLLATLGLTAAGVATKAYIARPDYTQLETYLQNKQWQKADKETDKIILKIAGETSELDTQSADRFSCQALEKIDRLWMNNSNDRFGFTPQKQAYLKTGNKFGEYAGSLYKEFGDRIDWWSGMADDWNLYNNLNFKNSSLAPIGHLPSPGTKPDEMNLRVYEREMLLSRFNECGF